MRAARREGRRRVRAGRGRRRGPRARTDGRIPSGTTRPGPSSERVHRHGAPNDSLGGRPSPARRASVLVWVIGCEALCASTAARGARTRAHRLTISRGRPCEGSGPPRSAPRGSERTSASARCAATRVWSALRALCRVQVGCQARCGRRSLRIGSASGRADGHEQRGWHHIARHARGDLPEAGLLSLCAPGGGAHGPPHPCCPARTVDAQPQRRCVGERVGDA